MDSMSDLLIFRVEKGLHSRKPTIPEDEFDFLRDRDKNRNRAPCDCICLSGYFSKQN
jgi:hypothetical protein